MSLICVFILFLSASLSLQAEDVLPAGTKLTFPDGTEKVLEQESTIISIEEKTILVRNDELWESDQGRIVALQNQIAELENSKSISQEEIQLVKDRLELEKERSAFYKEQMEVIKKNGEDTQRQLLEIIKEAKPSTASKVSAKVGWSAFLIALGFILAL